MDAIAIVNCADMEIMIAPEELKQCRLNMDTAVLDDVAIPHERK